MMDNGISVPKGPMKFMYRVYKYVLPEVRDQLGIWRETAKQIPDPELRLQAISSMTSKEFHCQGGAVYAAANLKERHVLIPLIVAFQTISDYLDNLCDRSTSLKEEDFRRLHQSMLDAIHPKAQLHDYYEFREEKNDGGYLHNLVKTCQSCISMLPSYGVVYPYVKELVGLYCDLQVYKHIHKDLREPKLMAWWEQHRHLAPDLNWNEFAAATGSTLGMFMLFLASTHEHLSVEEALSIRNRYFPYICGLHILLDYFIDQEEDKAGGDLNFCNYYKDGEETAERIEYVVHKSYEACSRLKYSKFHRMIVEGLMALYLSDPKVSSQQEIKQITRKMMKRSPMIRLFFWANSVFIRKKLYSTGG
ncbi:tetraprenyl-beta-curcumene synthase family protein [Marinicrinis lubricantis]|uniref:Tetraprenyl-beta-curcumene synthase family protein n=1 Tax=Marinicrinis lubricantis TaxID=2086470 RepID=A0ABW1ITY8_9BACL